MFDSFIDSLPEKVRSTNSFEYGTKFRTKESALNYKYIEVSQYLKKQIIIDIDRPGAAHDWEDRNLPAPSWIAINPENAHCHYCYQLNTPVVYTEAGRRAPQQYFEAVDNALTNYLDGDKGYVGKFTKNPLHPSWKIIKHFTSYDLSEFQEYIDLTPRRKSTELKFDIEGRNSTLFHTLRFFAYQIVKKHIKYEQFKSAVEDRGFEINLEFEGWVNGQLYAKEVLQTVNSISKWTWARRFTIGNYVNRGVMNLPDSMTLEQKQTASAYYANEVRTKTVLESIIESAKALKSQGTPITQQSVVIHSKCSLGSVKRVWKILATQFNLYTY
ncbi:MAG: replication initiation protein [Methylotenera sp.]|uniref:replication initiation protein n=1 Tax=Methylotenera sp. TaxID=2051956 RepID=UPI00272F939A|nr:replication initiation protein [Methylotenera sp.]MDP1521667.1 replication initiation protein [Methylotenera sp.]